MLDSKFGLLYKIALNFENLLMDKRSCTRLHKTKNMTQTCHFIWKPSKKNILTNTYFCTTIYGHPIIWFSLQHVRCVFRAEIQSYEFKSASMWSRSRPAWWNWKQRRHISSRNLFHSNLSFSSLLHVIYSMYIENWAIFLWILIMRPKAHGRRGCSLTAIAWVGPVGRKIKSHFFRLALIKYVT